MTSARKRLPLTIKLSGSVVAGLMIAFGILATPNTPATESPGLSTKEMDGVVRVLMRKRTYLRYCLPEDTTAVSIAVDGIRTRTWPGKVEIFINGSSENPGCIYVEEGGRFVHILDRFHRRPKSQPSVLPESAIPPNAKVWNAEDVARGIFEEVNLARSQPAKYAEYMAALLPYIQGRVLRAPNRPPLATEEGQAAFKEAIRFLRRVKPLPPLESSKSLSLACLDHVRDQGPRGAVGHRGADGSDPTERIRRHGVGYSVAAENITYGQKVARDVVIALIVDDGVPDRGHRKNLFHGGIDEMGVACGPHRTYEWMCVLDFVGSLR